MSAARVELSSGMRMIRTGTRVAEFGGSVCVEIPLPDGWDMEDSAEITASTEKMLSRNSVFVWLFPKKGGSE